MPGRLKILLGLGLVIDLGLVGGGDLRVLLLGVLLNIRLVKEVLDGVAQDVHIDVVEGRHIVGLVVRLIGAVKRMYGGEQVVGASLQVWRFRLSEGLGLGLRSSLGGGQAKAGLVRVYQRKTVSEILCWRAVYLR